MMNDFHQSNLIALRVMRTKTHKKYFSEILFGVFILLFVTLFESRSVMAEDISLEMFGPTSGVIEAGSIFTYEYNIRNLGPGVSEDVTLRDFLPEEVEFISGFVDSEGSVGVQNCGFVVPNVVWCPLGDLRPSGRIQVFAFVTVRLKKDTPDGVSLRNNADIDLSDTPDPNLGNNSDEIFLISSSARKNGP